MLKHASVLITFVTGILYTLGITFYQSYLRSLGVEETLFPLTIDRIIFQGFASSITMGLKALGWFYLAALGVFIVALIANVLIELVKKHKISSFIKRYRNDHHADSNDLNEFTTFTVKVVEYGSVLFIVLIGVLLILLATERAGSESAKNFINNCRDGKLKSHSVAAGSDNAKILGYPIVCNSDLCAYFSKESLLLSAKKAVYLVKSILRYNDHSPCVSRLFRFGS